MYRFAHVSSSIQVAATPLMEKAIGLSVDVKVADLQPPIPTFETTLGVNRPVTIQLPQVLSTQVKAAVELQPQHTVLFALPSPAGVRYLVTVQVGTPGETGDSPPGRGR